MVTGHLWLEGPCLVSSIWRGGCGESRGLGWWAASLTAGMQGAAINTPAPGRLSASRSVMAGYPPERHVVLKHRMQIHGYGSTGHLLQPRRPMPVALRALGEVTKSTHHGGPQPPADVISTHRSGHPFLLLWSLLFIYLLALPSVLGNLFQQRWNLCPCTGSGV